MCSIWDHRLKSHLAAILQMHDRALTGSMGSNSCLARFAGLAVGGFMLPLLLAAAAAGCTETLGADATDCVDSAQHCKCVMPVEACGVLFNC